MNKAHSPINWVNEPNTDTPINAHNLNKMDNTIGTLDDRIIVLNTTKANQTDLLTAIADVSFDENTGVITFTKKNGSTTKIDTNLEKLAVNFTYDKENQRLVITLEDGTIQYVDMKALITELEFLNSNTVLFSVSTDGKVSASIARGSITADMLEPNYLANVELYASQALQSAESAIESASQANSSAELAENYFNGAVDAVGQINKKLNIAEFEVNEDGYLTYNDDSSYNFAVDDNGYLNWEVA